MGLVALLLAAAAALLAAATAPASAAGAFSEVPPATPCTAAIVSIAPCLAHVALVAPPARPAPAPTEACCAAFLRGVSPSGGGEGCFCHLLRDPLLLGFPVNTARLGALLPTCAAANANASAAATVEAATLFANTCRPTINAAPIGGAFDVRACAATGLVWIGNLHSLLDFPCATCGSPVVVGVAAAGPDHGRVPELRAPTADAGRTTRELGRRAAGGEAAPFPVQARWGRRERGGAESLRGGGAASPAELVGDQEVTAPGKDEGCTYGESV
ncbi:hypothetical protein E2562_008160 [Oryza meyeriana var. granulata]|uniref:Bifunctional inhibitor/plant lipid transfer protein/seed storage helical domain-containing protein n=1 Tax=Oryza meyeriana var. granulata TaxID=110450 RepID=A0A6G1CG36_9ORYZ|nr:hypothetical protein E2562_008160 [Oryza meyeriana var. granulata]